MVNTLSGKPLTCGGAGVSNVPTNIPCTSLVWCSVPDEHGNISVTEDVIVFSVITCIDVFHALLCNTKSMQKTESTHNCFTQVVYPVYEVCQH